MSGHQNKLLKNAACRSADDNKWGGSVTVSEMTDGRLLVVALVMIDEFLDCNQTADICSELRCLQHEH